MTVNLTEIDVVKVAIGDKATVTLDAFPDKTFTGKILSVDTVGSITSGVTNYPTVIALDVQNKEMLSNMSASSSIITDVKNDVLLVPISAVETTDGASTVQVMNNGVPQMVSVHIGLSSDTQTEIISGVTEGQTVVTGTTTSGAATSTSTSSPFSPFGNRSGSGAVRMSR